MLKITTLFKTSKGIFTCYETAMAHRGKVSDRFGPMGKEPVVNVLALTDGENYFSLNQIDVDQR